MFVLKKRLLFFSRTAVQLATSLLVRKSD